MSGPWPWYMVVAASLAGALVSLGLWLLRWLLKRGQATDGQSV
jgi:uncharacterized membrane protein YwaF